MVRKWGGVRMWKADLQGADLSGADLSEANLCEVNLTGAIMPDGSIHS